MTLLQQFNEFIRQENLFSPKGKLLLAVSGGVDSVVLCELCHQAGFDFIIAHCNFRLRGEESRRDEQFVCGLGNKYGVEVLVKNFDTEKYAAEKKISIQEAARDLRYNWFGELVGKLNSELKTQHFLLTAHHADDNAETVMMNFCRGTGLHGLTGIPVSAGYIRRPLLNFSKVDLIGFARENKLDFEEDSSNQSSRYTRNLFRNEIIPLISKVYPQVKANLLDNINRFQETEKLYRFAVGELKKKLCKTKGREVHVPVKQLMSYNNRALIYDIISEYGFHERQVDEVRKLSESESGRFIQSPANDFRILKHRHWFIISPARSVETENIIIERDDATISFAEGTLQIETIQTSNQSRRDAFGTTSNQQLATSNYIACLDSKDIHFPLLLRKWKAGDYFYPLGMQKKKKLARFFIDMKMSRTEKEKLWVIESDQHIIWVVGYRIDDRFKITDKTKMILRLSLADS